MFGIDISRYQAQIDLERENSKYDFAIIKATEGVDYTDPCFLGFARRLHGLKKKIGVYHFVRADINKGTDGLKKELLHFMAMVKKAKLLGNAIICLDWECGVPLTKEYRQFIKEWFDEHYGMWPFIYGSEGTILDMIRRDGDAREMPIWVAKPGQHAGRLGKADISQLPKNPAYTWDIIQYSWVGSYLTTAGRKIFVDLDYTAITPDEWDSYAQVTLWTDIKGGV